MMMEEMLWNVACVWAMGLLIVLMVLVCGMIVLITGEEGGVLQWTI